MLLSGCSIVGRREVGRRITCSLKGDCGTGWESLPGAPGSVSAPGILIEQNGLYQRQLSEITMKDRPNISRIVTILEKKGYITKKGEDNNGRKVQKLYTTEKGRLEYNKIIDSVMEMRKSYIEGVDEEDMKGCLNVLAQVKKNLYDKVNMQT